MHNGTFQQAGSEGQLVTSSIEATIDTILRNQKTEIDNWFSAHYQKTEPFFYSSVDIRHSGHKLVPVDTNIFPAGFNLLHEKGRKNAIERFSDYFSTYFPNTQRILLVPENHTRNTFYLENVYSIQALIEQTGKEVMVGGLEAEEIMSLETAAGNLLTIHPVERKNNTLCTKDFCPDLIIVNNDFSAGAPDKLQDLDTPVIPPVGMGWYRRSKTHHFEVYNDLAREFCQMVDIDPWLISTVVSKCGEVNFKERSGLDCIALNVERTLNKVQQKYDEYGIKDDPYVFIKSDNGTYGMGIMIAKSVDDVMEINKKARNKMNSQKEGNVTSEVIIQEGIPTIDTVNDMPAEPMLYLSNGRTIACNYRINEHRDAYSNLNSQGMTFDNARGDDTEEGSSHNCPRLAIIAELASLAATHECYDEHCADDDQRIRQ